MSASSLSSCVRGADIIDLDRYMRASVRPSHPAHTREHLVVDAGGPGRVPVTGAGTDSDQSVYGPAGLSRRTPSPLGRDKRYSHDSGLSDGSYVKRRYRPHRRISESNGKPRDSGRRADSNSSVREFKAACEKAIRDQQQQIARMAELCQKLIEPTTLLNTPNSPQTNNTILNIPQTNNTTKNIPKAIVCNKTNTELRQNASLNSQPEQKADHPNDPNGSCYDNQLTANVNDPQQRVQMQNFGQNVTQNLSRRRRPVSYTSDVTSSSSGDRKNKHRTESCKTYNIIMNKLDEIGRMFAARRAPPPSSGSVSLRDKRVATDRVGNRTATVVQVVHAGGRGDRLAVTHAHDVDIAPLARKQSGTDAESIGQWSGSSDEALAHGQRFDLEDPLHLYAQAKRLQALHATAKRACGLEDKLGERFGGSLCSQCRGYWRALRRRIAHHLFGS